MVPILNLDTRIAEDASLSSLLSVGAMHLLDPPVTDAQRIREYIESTRREGESFTRALDRFAFEMGREPATIWRWLNGSVRIPAHLLRRLFPSD